MRTRFDPFRVAHQSEHRLAYRRGASQENQEPGNTERGSSPNAKQEAVNKMARRFEGANTPEKVARAAREVAAEETKENGSWIEKVLAAISEFVSRFSSQGVSRDTIERAYTAVQNPDRRAGTRSASVRRERGTRRRQALGAQADVAPTQEDSAVSARLSRRRARGEEGAKTRASDNESPELRNPARSKEVTPPKASLPKESAPEAKPEPKTPEEVRARELERENPNVPVAAVVRAGERIYLPFSPPDATVTFVRGPEGSPTGAIAGVGRSELNFKGGANVAVTRQENGESDVFFGTDQHSPTGTYVFSIGGKEYAFDVMASAASLSGIDRYSSWRPQIAAGLTKDTVRLFSPDTPVTIGGQRLQPGKEVTVNGVRVALNDKGVLTISSNTPGATLNVRIGSRDYSLKVIPGPNEKKNDIEAVIDFCQVVHDICSKEAAKEERWYGRKAERDEWNTIADLAYRFMQSGRANLNSLGLDSVAYMAKSRRSDQELQKILDFAGKNIQNLLPTGKLRDAEIRAKTIAVPAQEESPDTRSTPYTARRVDAGPNATRQAGESPERKAAAAAERADDLLKNVPSTLPSGQSKSFLLPKDSTVTVIGANGKPMTLEFDKNYRTSGKHADYVYFKSTLGTEEQYLSIQGKPSADSKNHSPELAVITVPGKPAKTVRLTPVAQETEAMKEQNAVRNRQMKLSLDYVKNTGHGRLLDIYINGAANANLQIPVRPPRTRDDEYHDISQKAVRLDNRLDALVKEMEKNAETRTYTEAELKRVIDMDQEIREFLGTCTNKAYALPPNP